MCSHHYKKTRLLQGKFASKNFSCKFATDFQRNCKKIYDPRKSLANLQGNISLANLQGICKNFVCVSCFLTAPSEICNRFAKNMHHICKFYHISLPKSNKVNEKLLIKIFSV